jgi:hypothetical protein
MVAAFRRRQSPGAWDRDREAPKGLDILDPIETSQFHHQAALVYPNLLDGKGLAATNRPFRTDQDYRAGLLKALRIIDETQSYKFPAQSAWPFHTGQRDPQILRQPTPESPR